MIELVPAKGAALAQILDATYDIWNEGLSRQAYARYDRAQLKTAWGIRNLTRLALVDGPAVLASAKLYAFSAVLDRRLVRVLGIGAVFTQPAHRGCGRARDLVERIVDRASRDGVDVALLFSEIGAEYYSRLGFEAVPTSDLVLRVKESERHGAPATLVRSGEPRDFPDIVSMGRVRSDKYRFHLDRDLELVQYAIAKKRLLAGLGPAGARELWCFIAEEGASAVAYVLVSVGRGAREAACTPEAERTRGADWRIEECGDRDPSGARAGAILQGLIAREPAERRPAICGWLPSGFLPPQVTIVERRASRDVMMIRRLSPAARAAPPLGEDDVLYWRGDVF